MSADGREVCGGGRAEGFHLIRFSHIHTFVRAMQERRSSGDRIESVCGGVR